MSEVIGRAIRRYSVSLKMLEEEHTSEYVSQAHQDFRTLTALIREQVREEPNFPQLERSLDDDFHRVSGGRGWLDWGYNEKISKIRANSGELIGIAERIQHNIYKIEEKYEEKIKSLMGQKQALENQLEVRGYPLRFEKLLISVLSLSHDVYVKEEKLMQVLPMMERCGEDILRSGNIKNFGSNLLKIYKLFRIEGASGDITMQELVISKPKFAEIEDQFRQLLNSMAVFLKDEIEEMGKTPSPGV